MDPYTGPYWSNGRIQQSVEFGDAFPRTWTGYNSRLHDSAFKHFPDARHRMAADYIYRQSLRLDDTKFGQMVRNMPFIGNNTGFVMRLLTDPKTIPSLVGNVIATHGQEALLLAYVWSGNLDKEIADVLQYYQTDPDIALRYAQGGITAEHDDIGVTGGLAYGVGGGGIGGPTSPGVAWTTSTGSDSAMYKPSTTPSTLPRVSTDPVETYVKVPGWADEGASPVPPPTGGAAGTGVQKTTTTSQPTTSKIPAIVDSGQVPTVQPPLAADTVALAIPSGVGRFNRSAMRLVYGMFGPDRTPSANVGMVRRDGKQNAAAKGLYRPLRNKKKVRPDQRMVDAYNRNHENKTSLSFVQRIHSMY